MSASSSKTPDSNREKYLDDDFAEWIKSRLLQAHQPGVAVAVIKDGHVESSGFGLAQLPDIPATADTLWLMASTTKAFTTTLLGKVLEDQAIRRSIAGAEVPEKAPVTWKTPVSEVLPEFVTTDDYVTKHATIDDIASHRSGVAGHDLVWGPVMGSSLSTATRWLRHFEAIEGKFRNLWQYNNLMYAVLGDIVEHVTGSSFDEVLQKEILEPLGMQNTWLGLSRVAERVRSGAIQKNQVSRGYYYVEDEDKENDEKGYYVVDQFSELTGIEPAGALVSSVNDYAKWVQALLKAANSKADNDKDCREGNLISQELWKELTTPRIHITAVPFDSSVTLARPSSHAMPSSYCLGWVVDPYMYPGEIMLSHGGGLLGYSSIVTMLPDQDIGLVVVGNGGMLTPITEVVAKELFGRRLGLSKEERRRIVKKDNKPKTEAEVTAPLQDVPITSTNADSGIVLSDTEQTVKLETDTSPLEGHYVHPAYGTLQIKTASISSALTEKRPNINGARIIRQNDSYEKSKDSRSPPDTKGLHPLHVTALGSRGLPTSYLLHRSPNQPYPGKIIYDLESMWLHGDLSKETVKGLEPEINESSDEGYPLKQAVVWQSIGIKQAAAVFERVGGSHESGARVDRVGLRLMRVDGSPKSKKKEKSESILEPGWEARMIWMSKLYTQEAEC